MGEEGSNINISDTIVSPSSNPHPSRAGQRNEEGAAPKAVPADGGGNAYIFLTHVSLHCHLDHGGGRKKERKEGRRKEGRKKKGRKRRPRARSQG